LFLFVQQVRFVGHHEAALNPMAAAAAAAAAAAD
jgi:hypothetical protein